MSTCSGMCWGEYRGMKGRGKGGNRLLIVTHRLKAHGAAESFLVERLQRRLFAAVGSVHQQHALACSSQRHARPEVTANERTDEREKQTTVMLTTVTSLRVECTRAYDIMTMIKTELTL